MKGVLYGVGVGPGDPSLITLKALEIIKASGVIAVPDTGGEKAALNVISAYTAGKEIMPCPMPMTKEKDVLAQSHRQSAELICGRLDEGTDVAFITLGDPSIYSTYMYLQRLVLQKGFSARMIPGVPSFCAVAAALGSSLCEGGEPLHIIPAAYGRLDENLALKGTKVLMKSGRDTAEIKRTLKKLGLFKKAQMVECCGMENESVYRSVSDAKDIISYFSTIIVKDNE